MPASPTDLFRYFDELNIAHTTVEHPATFTVEEGRHLKASIPGGHTKNLFMKDKDGTIVLISAWVDSVLKLNQLHKLIGTRRLSFSSADLMQEVLGVAPGSVTPFALINDTKHQVRLIADSALMAFEMLNFHPLINTATTTIKTADFRRFVEATGHTMSEVDFTQFG